MFWKETEDKDYINSNSDNPNDISGRESLIRGEDKNEFNLN